MWDVIGNEFEGLIVTDTIDDAAIDRVKEDMEFPSAILVPKEFQDEIKINLI